MVYETQFEELLPACNKVEAQSYTAHHKQERLIAVFLQPNYHQLRVYTQEEKDEIHQTIRYEMDDNIQP